MIALCSVLLWACSIAFLASIPALLAIRARRPGRMPWWLVIILSAALGWAASNCFVFVELWQIDLDREELSKQFILADYFVTATPSQTLPWGWTAGLVYLAICRTLYTLLRDSMNRPPSRALVGLLITACGLLLFTRVPPWNNFENPTPSNFVFIYMTFLLVSGLSYQVLRKLRLQQTWHPLVVTIFLAPLCIYAADLFTMAMNLLTLPPKFASFLTLKDSLPGIAAIAKWTVLYGASFTAFWWIAIRPSSAEGTVPRTGT